MRRLAACILTAVLLIGLAAPAYAGGQHHGGGHHGGRHHHHGSWHHGNWRHGGWYWGGGFSYSYPYYPLAVYEQPVYAPPVTYYAQPPVAYAVATPPPVIYPHGRYEFSGRQWVWIPNAPVSPPAECRPTGRYVQTPQGLLPECQ